MIAEEQLKQLQGFDGSAPVLSVYLSLEPGRQPEAAHQTAFKGLVHGVRGGLNDDGRARLDAEAAAVQAWLDREPPQGLGLAIFSCQPAGLWQAHFLPIVVADHVAYEAAPHLTPLLDLLEEHARYAVVLVDKEQARLFTVRLNQIEEERYAHDDVYIDESHTGWDEGKYERQHDALVQRHLKETVARLERLQRRRPFDRLFVGGLTEAASALQRLLPPPLAARLADTFNATVDLTGPELLARTQPLAKRAEREAEARLLDELLDLAAPGGRAVRGVTPTLDTLFQAAVRTLVVADGVRLSGAECTNCGRLLAGDAAACTLCGGTTRPVGDLVEWAVERTFQQGGDVELIHGDAAARLREEGAGLGALLRFPLPA